MPIRHKEAPSEEQLYAPVEWRSAGEFEDILYEKADGIAKITINRPDVRNAFRPQTLAELRDAFNRARDDLDVGSIIFTGAGTRRSAPAVTSGSGAMTATSATTRSLSTVWGGWTWATSTSRSAACRSRWWRWSRATPWAAGTSSTWSVT